MTKYSHFLEKAVRLAVEKHEGQVDKGGRPYIFHLLRVMNKMPSDDLKIVAVLHDLLEDTGTTEIEIRDIGVPVDLIRILRILNKKQHNEYDTYINLIGHDIRATKVKLADLEDNMDITRLNEIDENVVEHLKKYLKAWKRLKVLSERGEAYREISSFDINRSEILPKYGL